MTYRDAALCNAPDNGFSQEGRGGGRSGIPTGFDLKLPPLGWEFEKFVLPQGGENYKHWVDC